MRMFVVFPALVAMAFGIPTFPWETIPEVMSQTDFLARPIPINPAMLKKRVVDCSQEELMTVISTTIHSTIKAVAPECTDIVMTRLTIGFVKYLAYNQLDTVYRLLQTRTVEDILTLIRKDSITEFTPAATWDPSSIIGRPVEPTIRMQMMKPRIAAKIPTPSIVRKDIVTVFELIRKVYYTMIETQLGSMVPSEINVDVPLEQPFFALSQLPTRITNLRTVKVGYLVEQIKTILLPTVAVIDVSKCSAITRIPVVSNIARTFVNSLEGLDVEKIVTILKKEGLVVPVELKPLIVKLRTVTKTLHPFEYIVDLLSETRDAKMLINPVSMIISKKLTTTVVDTILVTSTIKSLVTINYVEIVKLAQAVKTMEITHAVDLLSDFMTRLAIKVHALGVSTIEVEAIMSRVVMEIVEGPMGITYMSKMYSIGNRAYGIEV